MTKRAAKQPDAQKTPRNKMAGTKSIARRSGDQKATPKKTTARTTVGAENERESAAHTARQVIDRRPTGVDDATVKATGKVSEALEWIERARGSLYEFHQKSGHADLLLGEAADALEAAGHPDVATQLRDELVGRNVIEGRWTFQIVEDYDDTYWGPVRRFDQVVRDQLMGGARHVFESEMKERRRSHGLRHHEARPTDAPAS